MCGICFICGVCMPEIDKLIASSQKQIYQRGPDFCQVKKFHIDELQIALQGSVLWLQGQEPMQQPLTDREGNILLWNGDILDGHKIPDHLSDTKHLLNLLTYTDDIAPILSKIKGPWSFIYYKKYSNRLYFGRDMFGRHSLLWQIPNENQELFMLISVFLRSKNVQEVPALGLYYVDLDTKMMNDFSVNLIPWEHISEDTLKNIDSFIRVDDEKMATPLTTCLDTVLPTDKILDTLRSLPQTLGKEDSEELYSFMYRPVDDLLKVLRCSIQRRVDRCPAKCQKCTRVMTRCDHSKYAVLFSGGLDSAMIALLLDSCLDLSENIDLLNVAFAKNNDNKNETKKDDNSGSGILDFDVPDRITGRESYHQLQELCPGRNWNFVEIDITSEELAEERGSNISHLVAPLDSVLDDSIGCALWFGGRGKGHISGSSYSCPARVLLCGMGADEQLGGYARHRGRFTAGGWSALLEEIHMEISRIHSRNLGRDNRILADHGRAPRFPYLDEDVVSYLNALPIWMKANLTMPRGMGEKLILRVAASSLGLTVAAGLPKRAIQFGSRIAKLENSKEKGSDSCHRLQT